MNRFVTPLLNWLNPNRTHRGSATDQLAAAVAVPAPGCLRGWTDWPHDRFYRPLIAIVVDGTVRAVTPSWRRAEPAAMDAMVGGNCVFAVVLPAAVLAGASSIVAVRMEDGARASLSGAPATAFSDTPQAWHGAPMPDGSDNFGGFESFLTLDCDDQIELVCRSLIGQASPPADAPAARVMRAQEMTILDFRDALLDCASFRDATLDQPWQQSGRWLVWSGLAAIATDLIGREITGSRLAEDDRAASLVAVRAALAPSDYFVRLSLGPDIPPPEAAHWFATLAQLPARSVTPAAPALQSSSYALVMPGLMRALQPGPAGMRSGQGFASQPGVPGFIIAGPYLRLGAGTWRLVVSLAHGPDTPPPRGFIEVIHQDTVVALAPLAAASSAELSFCLTAAWAGWLSAPLFEVRIWSDGQARLAVNDLMLERIGPPGTQALAGVANWRPLLSIGEAGIEDASAIQAPIGQDGIVFFGPYRALPPGDYRLTVELVEVAISDRASCTLELLSEAGEAIAATTVNLAARAGEYGLDFVVTPALADRRLEFRLRKNAEAGFHVTTIGVVTRQDDAG